MNSSTNLTKAHFLPAPPLPRVSDLPLLGSLPRLARDHFDALLAFAREAGDIFDLNLGVFEVTMLCHPKLADEVLIRQAKNFLRGGLFYEPVYALIGNGLPAADGDLWRRHRRMMQPHFHAHAIAKLTQRVARTIDGALESWAEASRGGRVMDIEPLAAELALTMGLAVAFGEQLEPERSRRLGEALTVGIDQIAAAWMTHTLPRWLPLPSRRRFAEALEIMDEEVFALIAERRAAPDPGDDILGLLLEAGREIMTERQLRDEIISMFLAGYDTSANVLSWALVELARRPEIFARMRAEVDAVLGDDPPSPEDVRRLIYTRQVYDETLRVYPPALWIPKVAQADTRVGGYEIRAGQTVMVSIYNIHHNPSQWSDPEHFDPGRFAPGRDHDRHKLAFMPYGAGQHKCIGEALANLEGTLSLAAIVRRFDLRLVETPTLRMKTTIRSKDGIHIELRERS